MRKLVAFALLLAVSSATHAELLLFGDAARGEKLHAQHCKGCHDSSVYTRPDRRIRSGEGLQAQVAMCNRNLRSHLGKEQLDDLVKYLNDTFYKFK
jgi:mono/diheme cytochrome c family protein